MEHMYIQKCSHMHACAYRHSCMHIPYLHTHIHVYTHTNNLSINYLMETLHTYMLPILVKHGRTGNRMLVVAAAVVTVAMVAVGILTFT